MSEPSNDERAQRALAGVRAYAHRQGFDYQRSEPLQDQMRDLLCDLRHLADQQGVDFDRITASASQLHQEEVEACSN